MKHYTHLFFVRLWSDGIGNVRYSISVNDLATQEVKILYSMGGRGFNKRYLKTISEYLKLPIRQLKKSVYLDVVRVKSKDKLHKREGDFEKWIKK